MTFLSPYVNITNVTSGAIFLVNTLTHQTVKFSGEEVVVSQLMELLENGGEEDDLSPLLEQLSPKVDILMLFQKGFLE